MRRALVVAIAFAAAGCNAVLDIPERPLAPGDASTGDGVAQDTAADTTTQPDTESDGPPDVVNDDVPTDSPDATPSDTADGSVPDSIVADASDSAIPDAISDTAVDTGTDTGTPDTGTPDTFVDTGTDTGTPDTVTPDTGTDTGSDAATCGVAGKPCCGYVPATCDTNAVCSSGSCVAATGACVRATDCPGKVCGGPTLCAGSVCFACTTVSGSKSAFEPCTSSSECKSGVCDIIRDVCSSACANGITGDSDCTALGSKVVCSEGNITWTSGSVTASGKMGFCARSCVRDAECKATEVCRTAGNEDQNRIDVLCSPPRAGTVPYGGTCTSTSDCRGGFCLTYSVPLPDGGTASGKACSNFCASNADCTHGSLTKCTPLNFLRPKGGTQVINACTP